MRFMVLVKATAGSEAGAGPGPELLAQMMRYNEGLAAAGVLKGGEGLAPSSAGARVRFSGASRSVAAGPFAPDAGLIAGYWILEAPSLEEAVEWVRKAPNPTGDEGEIEIRRILGPDDFAQDDPSGELRRTESTLRARIGD